VCLAGPPPLAPAGCVTVMSELPDPDVVPSVLPVVPMVLVDPEGELEGVELLVPLLVPVP
jgi:hypothetical protein